MARRPLTVTIYFEDSIEESCWEIEAKVWPDEPQTRWEPGCAGDVEFDKVVEDIGDRQGPRREYDFDTFAEKFGIDDKVLDDLYNKAYEKRDEEIEESWREREPDCDDWERE